MRFILLPLAVFEASGKYTATTEELPRVVNEAFLIASSGRPGPVLIDLPKDVQVDESRLKRIEAIVNSMTTSERNDHSLIDGKRRKRIARGRGRIF